MKNIKILLFLLLYIVAIFYLSLYYMIQIFIFGFIEASATMLQYGVAAFMIFIIINTINHVFIKNERH
jgi:hypothetical protein